MKRLTAIALLALASLFTAGVAMAATIGEPRQMYPSLSMWAIRYFPLAYTQFTRRKPT